MPATASRTALDAAQQLLECRPALRNRWLLETRKTAPRRVAEMIAAVELTMGTPYGLWHDDPVGFVEVGLGETLWAGQRRILQALVDHERTVVPSCHAAGKTFTAARAVAWCISTNAPGMALAVTTATHWRQVRNLLWMSPSGIKPLHAKAKLPGVCLQTEWQLDGKVVAYGFSPADVDETAFSGIHAPKLLMVVDEAGGLSPILGRSLESTMSTGHARLLAIGNPPEDETGSPWMEERCASPSYHVERVSAFDTPNFTGEVTPLCREHPDLPAHRLSDHLVTPAWVQTVTSDEGADSAYYVARVLAQFPKDVQRKTIPRTWLDEAAANDSPEPGEWIRLGVDVAADGGDRFVIARAEGHTVRVVHSERPPGGVTTFDLAGKVLEAIQDAEALRMAAGIVAPIRVKVDALGIGMGVADTLVAWGYEGLHQAEVVPVSVSESVDDPDRADRFANKRAEMWWLGRELSQPREGLGLPTWRLEVDSSVLTQLNAPKYGRTSNGRIQIESKPDMKRRGVHSPDEAEAVLLAVYEPGYAGEATWGAPTSMSLPPRGRRG